MKAAFATSMMVFVLLLNTAAAQTILFDDCGVLDQGLFCVLFEADSGGTFVLDNYANFQAGDQVRVTGDLRNPDPTCPGTCQDNVDGCIRNNVISECTIVPLTHPFTNVWWSEVFG